MYSLWKDILGSPIDPLYHPPSTYTGELLGIEYLFFESGKTIHKEVPSLDEMDVKIEKGMKDDEIIPSDPFQVAQYWWIAMPDYLLNNQNRMMLYVFTKNNQEEYHKKPLKFDRTKKPAKGRFARTKEEPSSSQVNVETMRRYFPSGGAPSQWTNSYSMTNMIVMKWNEREECVEQTFVFSGERQRPYTRHDQNETEDGGGTVWLN